MQCGETQYAAVSFLRFLRRSGIECCGGRRGDGRILRCGMTAGRSEDCAARHSRAVRQAYGRGQYQQHDRSGPVLQGKVHQRVSGRHVQRDRPQRAGLRTVRDGDPSRSDPRKARYGRRRGLHDRLQRDAAHPRLPCGKESKSVNPNSRQRRSQSGIAFFAVERSDFCLLFARKNGILVYYDRIRAKRRDQLERMETTWYSPA